ncbi:hypothetical protein DBR32_12695 [Taibaiella sp. KBW10]|uniref:ribonuclease H-like YkuK family protein n=1 Tax=Taibaiella sp. KBW10 TaxID=2153357 RepID=UPI000F59A4F9|nr:ribonuclease H-like YkuK family protein [Taibaiella sp. KBW10]RQO30419.1 hypothetical protein DBR32_12695 [Taibaiella sp. KBW10]
MEWKRLNGSSLKLPIKQAVEETIIAEQEKGNRIKLFIGTDSQVFGRYTDFATVIVFLREKKGGFMFVHHKSDPRLYAIKERMLLEVAKSIQVAYDLCDVLTTYNVEMEVHADINTDPHFKSNIALSEAMGYILGMGFAFKAKPHAFASSTCADRIIH